MVADEEDESSGEDELGDDVDEDDLMDGGKAKVSLQHPVVS